MTKRLVSIAALLMLLAATAFVPAALADDDGDDNGGSGGGTSPTLQDVCVAANSPTNLVKNGDFEVPPAPPGGFTTWFQGTGPTFWTVTEGSVDQVHELYWQAACGLHSIDMTGTPGQGTLTQAVGPTVAGQTYRLTFAWGANPDPACEPLNEPTAVGMNVRWGGQTVAVFTPTRTPDFSPPRDPLWQPFQATVVGQAGTTLLEFDSVSGTFCGVTIDAVSVQQVDGDDDGDDDADDDGDDDGEDDGEDNGDDGNGEG
jgi:Protein of unknown function (DUF642)